MMKFFESKQGKDLMSKLYGWGASVVILGAMFKILHWDGADLMLTLGLTTEAVIFFISGFEKPHAEYDWSLVYPQLSGKKSAPESPVEELDQMLENANVDQELIQSLGEGLKKVSDAANGLGSVSDIASSTNEYSTQVSAAAKNLENINSQYEAQIASTIEQTEATRQMASNMSYSLSDAQQMQEEMAQLRENLNALNSVYGNMLSAMNSNK
ncbi:MAG: gliding motility protein GldL [Flavobacteriales bacterium]|nr:gliding motility protein GldL [Flavobacteriales bacterium]